MKMIAPAAMIVVGGKHFAKGDKMSFWKRLFGQAEIRDDSRAGDAVRRASANLRRAARETDHIPSFSVVIESEVRDGDGRLRSYDCNVYE